MLSGVEHEKSCITSETVIPDEENINVSQLISEDEAQDPDCVRF